MAQRADRTAQAEIGGVDQPQQTIAEHGIGSDDAFQFLWPVVGVLKRCQQAHHAQAGFRYVAFTDNFRAEEEVALKQVETQCQATLKVVVRLHLLRDKTGAKTAQSRDLFGEFAVGAIGYFDLDDVGEFEQRIDFRGVFAKDEIVEHDQVATARQFAQCRQ